MDNRNLVERRTDSRALVYTDRISGIRKAGSVLPLYNRVKNLNSNNEEIIVNVFPGGSGSFCFYEDNGNDKYYADEYARTRIACERKDNLLTVTIAPRKAAIATCRLTVSLR